MGLPPSRGAPVGVEAMETGRTTVVGDAVLSDGRLQAGDFGVQVDDVDRSMDLDKVGGRVWVRFSLQM